MPALERQAACVFIETSLETIRWELLFQDDVSKFPLSKPEFIEDSVCDTLCSLEFRPF